MTGHSGRGAGHTCEEEATVTQRQMLGKPWMLLRVFRQRQKCVRTERSHIGVQTLYK